MVLVKTSTLQVNTQGFCDVHNITPQIQRQLQEHEMQHGTATIFVPGATACITTIEFESGAVQDFKDAIERMVPQDMEYQHNARWHDGNGFSHVRAAMMGPSLTIPFGGGKLSLGTWQQIILVDFDNRPRNREIMINMIGE